MLAPVGKAAPSKPWGKLSKEQYRKKLRKLFEKAQEDYMKRKGATLPKEEQKADKSGQGKSILKAAP